MEILEQIEAYLAANRVSPSTFGRQAAGDPRLVFDLKQGRRPRKGTQERILRYLQSKSGRLT